MKEKDFREVYAGFFGRVHRTRRVMLGCLILMGAILLALIIGILAASK